MKISNIDKDFVNIINYLDKVGFKPFASCDGVVANHDDPDSVISAYISFLKSPQIIDLMAVFLRDKETFEVTISNNTHNKQYYLYDNLIDGNNFSVYFSNKDGKVTDYFEKIIMNVVDKNINIPSDKKEILNKLSEILEDDENSDLYFRVSFNSKYQPYMRKNGKINVLNINTKAGCKYYRDMNELIEMLSKQYVITKKSDGLGESYAEDEFAVSRDSSCEIYFKDEYVEQILNQINYIKEIEQTLSIHEVREDEYDYDYEDIIFDDDEYEL